MSKDCINPSCKKAIPSNDAYCRFCGIQQVSDGELSEEVKLRKELDEVKIKEKVLIEQLAVALNHTKEGTPIEFKETIAQYNEKIIKYNETIVQCKNEIIDLHDDLTAIETKVKKRTVFFYFAIILLGLLSILLGLNLISANKNLEESIVEQERLERKINDISKYPIIIKSLTVGNVNFDNKIETKHGDQLYSVSSMYLEPQIEYFGLHRDTTIMLYEKLYMNGILSQSPSSPSGYTTECAFHVSNSGITRLKGWGDKKKGYWPTGNYRYEIWYNNLCLGSINFKLK